MYDDGHECNEAEASMWKSIEDAIKTRIENEHTELLKDIVFYENQTKRLNEKIRELELQIPNQENLRKQCIEEVRKEMFGSFKPGQTVYIKRRKAEYVQCTTCAGTGKAKQILATGEQEIKCPSCHGSKKQTKYTGIPEKDTVGSVRIMLTKDNNYRTIVETKIYIRSEDTYKKLTEVFATEEECWDYIRQEEQKKVVI